MANGHEVYIPQNATDHHHEAQPHPMLVTPTIVWCAVEATTECQNQKGGLRIQSKHCDSFWAAGVDYDKDDEAHETKLET